MSSLLVFSRVYRRKIRSVMLAFSTGFLNYCPSNLFSGWLSSSPLPYVNKYTVYTYTGCKGGVWGHRRRGGLIQIKNLPQSSFTGQFFYITTFGIAFYQSNLSTGRCVTQSVPAPFYSRLLDRYSKTTGTVFPFPLILTSWVYPSSHTALRYLAIPHLLEYTRSWLLGTVATTLTHCYYTHLLYTPSVTPGLAKLCTRSLIRNFSLLVLVWRGWVLLLIHIQKPEFQFQNLAG